MATYPNDATPNSGYSGFSSMADRKPDRGYSSDREYNVIIFESESGYERRGLRTRRPKRTYDLTYTNVNGVIKQAIENFYIARSGSFESFAFDLTHVGESGTLYVRFDGALSIKEVKSGSTAIIDDVFTVSFKLVETYT